MHRNFLLEKLRSHTTSDAHEEKMRRNTIAFIEQHGNCFERSLSIGHITGSALIVNAERTHTLLTHHFKLNKWLQLGGHSDGDPNTVNVALREAQEESGIQNIKILSENIFDVDMHLIPARKSDPEHFHYDIRFLFEADSSLPFTVSRESNELAWVELKKIEDYTQEESILRMVRKLSSK